VGEGLRTGDADPFGEPNLRIIVEDIVFLAACLALSVLTKLVTNSSRFPVRLGEARSSRGPTSVLEDGDICVIEDPFEGDSRVEEVGEDNVEFRGEEEFEFLLKGGFLSGYEPCLSKLLVEKLGCGRTELYCRSKLP